VLLILDAYSSHAKNLQLIDKAKKNNIIIISLPSHCTHRLQPLVVSVFKNTNYNREVQAWLCQHPGRSVTEFQIAALFGSAYTKADTVKHVISGFRKCGITPFNPHIFSDDDFDSADATDTPNPSGGLLIPQPNAIPVNDPPVQQPNATPMNDPPVPQPNATPVSDPPIPEPNATPVSDPPVQQPNATPVSDPTRSTAERYLRE